VRGDRRRQPVVDFAADRNRQLGLLIGERLDTGLDVREHLHVDPRGVHETDALRSDVAEPGPHGLVFPLQRLGKQVPHSWVEERFFQRHHSGD
jgi:hypothetical protein